MRNMTRVLPHLQDPGVPVPLSRQATCFLCKGAKPGLLQPISLSFVIAFLLLSYCRIMHIFLVFLVFGLSVLFCAVELVSLPG